VDVEVFRRPVALLGLHRRGIVEARLRSLLPANNAPEIGTDAVRLALAEGMAGSAFFRSIFPAADIGAGKPHRQRFLGGGRLARLAVAVLLQRRDLVARLFGIVRREYRAGG